MVLPGFSVLSAQTDNIVNAYVFYGQECPHCAKESIFLSELSKQYPNLQIYEYEVYHDRENALLMQKVAKILNTDAGGVPFLVMGDKYFIGYGEGITDKEIEAQLNKCLATFCPDSIAEIVGAEPGSFSNSDTNVTENKEKIIKLPLLEEIDVYKFSLPALAVVMGTLDGFNPCAMWVLLFLISLLLGMDDRRRMWILGSVFIIASALVYFVFMAAWLNLIIFLGFIIWVRVAIAILALGGGFYSLNKFFTNKAATCEITSGEKQQQIFDKLKSAVNQKNFFLALAGIIILAFMVNLVELVCSAGLPAVFTQVLALNELANWQYYGYILLYIFFFMLDDLLVFFLAMITLRITGLTNKYSRYSRLIGGILMIIIGFLLLFKPEWLMF